MEYSIVVFENVTIYVALILLLCLLRCYNRGRRMKNVRENEVEAYLRRQVEKLGGLCLKIPADYMRGVPDRIVLLPHGVLVWVETKRPSGGRVSGSQLVVHEMLRRLGQQVVIVWSKEDADELLHHLAG